MKKKKNPKVSIIVPVHNAAITLDRCVKSIIEQEYENLECILIENGSLDDSRKICLEYEKKNSKIKVYVSDKNGVSEARNLGLSAATGDIIGFCDADDFIENNAIKMIVAEFQRASNISCVISAFYVGKLNEGIIEKQFKGEKRKQLSVLDAMCLTIGSDAVMGSVWNKYYRADIIKNTLFDSTLSYCEDMHFNIKVMAAMGNKDTIILIDSPMYCYMENGDSVTHQVDKLFDQNGELKYIKSMKKILKECSAYKGIVSIAKMKIACFAIDTISNMKPEGVQRLYLLKELQENYIYLLKNIFKFNWKWNLKRAYWGFRILISKK